MPRVFTIKYIPLLVRALGLTGGRLNRIPPKPNLTMLWADIERRYSHLLRPLYHPKISAGQERMAALDLARTIARKP